ncbi:hypothetical protein PENTCL1PPCAC_7597, partial [Pristionchus entomophagus]
QMIMRFVLITLLAMLCLLNSVLSLPAILDRRNGVIYVPVEADYETDDRIEDDFPSSRQRRSQPMDNEYTDEFSLDPFEIQPRSYDPNRYSN